jgi:hypothetical protein
MIRIERGAEVAPGVFAYAVPSLGLSGRSRQPLLDACRQIAALLGPTSATAGLFREGRDDADISCTVEVGAGLTVEERAGRSIRFVKFKPFERFAEAADCDDIASRCIGVNADAAA